MYLKPACFIVLFFLVAAPCRSGGLCEEALRFEVLANDDSTTGFLWLAGERKTDVYYCGPDLVVNRRKSGSIWLLRGQNFNPYPGSEMYIDSAYFGEGPAFGERLLFVVYSLFSMRPNSSLKTHMLMAIDLHEKKLLFNLATYDYRLDKDENGRLIEYLYEAALNLSHNSITVSSTEDSDVDNLQVQLPDGLYVHHGHCYVRKREPGMFLR